MEDKKKFGWVLAVVVFLLALLVRGVYLWESRGNPSFSYPVVDAAGYDQMVRHLLDAGEMKIDFFWQQFFYPAYLWVIYWVSGSSVLAAKIVQLVLGGVTCGLVYRLGCRLVDRRVGALAGIMMGLYGPAVLHELELVPAGWTAFWAVALLLAFLGAQEKKTWWSFLWLGLCGGLSSITRPNFLPVLLVGCVWLAWKLGGIREMKVWVGKMLVAAVGFAVVALSVSAVNYWGVDYKADREHFGFLPASGGLNLYIGNHPDYAAAQVRPGRGWHKVIVLPETAGYENDMWERADYFYDRTFEYLREEPAKFAKGLGRKSLQLISSREMVGNIDAYHFAEWSGLMGKMMWKVGSFGFPFGVLAPLAAVGLVFCWRRMSGVLVIMLLLYGGALVMAHVESRYRLGLVVGLAVPAAAGVVELIKMVRGRDIRRLVGAVVLIAAVVALGTAPGPFVEEGLDLRAELHYGVGTNAETRGEEDYALASYESALEIDGDYADAHNNLALILARRGRIDEAKEHYREALRAGGDSSDVYMNVGNLLLREGDVAGALENYREALGVRPRWAKGHMGLGMAWAADDRAEQAIRQYEKAVELDATYDEARKQLAGAYLRSGRMDEAAQHLEVLSKSQSHEVDVHFNLAGIYARQGKVDQAIEQLRMVLALEPGDLDSRCMLGTLLAKAGEREAARRELEEVLRRDPSHGRARRQLEGMGGR